MPTPSPDDAGSRISLPTGGGALRGLGETFSADPQSGTGNFTVPLEVPPGRAGLTPKLALAYSTGSPNGPFGLGWTLDVPAVRRQTRSGLPRYTGQDVFVLSGHEDLVPVGDSTSQGDGTVRYRPRSEGLFARISRHGAGAGDTWVVETKEGLRSSYGTTSASRISDPANPGRVFAWLLDNTVDLLGNRIEYGYARDESRVDGAHVWDQLYLSEIRYADYGDRADPSFLCRIVLRYEDRPDRFSDYRAGFEIRTVRRCVAIETWTGTATPLLSRVVHLGYSKGANGVSLLRSIRVEGVDGDTTESLPPLTLGYTGYSPERQRWIPLSAPGGPLPVADADHPDTDLVDVDGTGLPSVVQFGGTPRIWRNRGGGRFAAGRVMSRTPGLSPASPGVVLVDADGDGRLDLMVSGSPGQPAGYFPLSNRGEFDAAGFVRLDLAPSFEVHDPRFRLLDLDGDGVIDGLRFDGTSAELFYNDRASGWRTAQRVPAPAAGLDLANPRLRTADMTGDGSADLVLLGDGRIDYWPYLGYGRWGERITMHAAPRISEAGTGEQRFDPRRLLLGDVDGDGCADVVYVGNGTTTIWLNCSGQSFGPPRLIRGTPPMSDEASVRLADVLGNGTTGLLWTDRTSTARDGAYRFLDLTGSTKPYLLEGIDNGRGAQTKIDYGTSTKFMIDDAAAGRVWRTSLPFPVHVVTRTTVVDVFSGARQITAYRYAHGHWDPVEREFRGFARVDTTHSSVAADERAPARPARELPLDPHDRARGLPTTLAGRDARRLGNLLGNWSFTVAGAGPTRLAGQSVGASSAAESWTLWNAGLPDTVSTSQLIPTTLPGATGAMIDVTTTGAACGLRQRYADAGAAADVVAQAWVFVRRGRVSLGTGPAGSTAADVVSSHTGQWILLEAPNGGAPAEEVVLASVDATGADFSVACVWVRAREADRPPLESPPVVTRTWYSVGPVGPGVGGWSELDLSDEYWEGDGALLGPAFRPEQTDGLSRRQLRDGLRSTRGRILRTELYARDGDPRADRPYTVTEHQYHLRCEGPSARVWSCAVAAERTTQWDRGDDPSTTVTWTDSYDAYGRSAYTLVVSVPRGHDPRTTAPPGIPYLATSTVTDWATRDDDRYLCDRSTGTTRYELVNDGSSSLLDLRAAEMAGTVPHRLIAQTTMRYDGAAFDGLPLGTLGAAGLPTRAEVLAVTPGTLAEAWGTTAVPPYMLIGEATPTTGLLASFFADDHLETAAYVQPAAGVDHTWGTCVPDPVLRPDHWSVRWSGKLRADVTGSYRLRCDGTGGVRLRIGNQLLVDDWPGALSDRSTTVTLTADQPVALSIEYRPATGQPAGLRLLWTTPGQAEQVVPADKMMPAARPERWPADTPPAFTAAVPPGAGYVYRQGTDGMAPGWYVCTGTRYDVHDAADGRGLVIAERDPFGAITTRGYDPTGFLLTTVTDPVGLTVKADYDLRVLRPVSSTDPNGCITRYGYDPLGELAWVASSWQGTGDTPEQPGIRYERNDLAYVSSDPGNRQPCWTHTTTRVRHRSDIVADERARLGRDPTADELAALFPPDEAARFPERFLQARSLTDGFGRVLQTRTQHDPLQMVDLGLPAAPGSAVTDAVESPAGGPVPVVVSGWQQYDDKGRVVRAWEPFFDLGFDYAPPAIEQLTGALRWSDTHYDAVGRVTRVVRPDGTQQRTVNGALADADNPAAVVPTPWERWTYDPVDEMPRTSPLRSLASAASWNTPASVVVDPRGRTVVTAEGLEDGGRLTTTTRYDVDGNVMSVTDPMGRITAASTHDQLKRVWRSEFLDAGVTRKVLDALGGVVEARDAKGALVLATFDAAHRPDRQWRRDRAGQAVGLREVTVFGEASGQSDAAARGLYGRAWRTYDEAGMVECSRYDLHGQVTERTRRTLSVDVLLAALPNGTGDWGIGYQLDWQPTANGTLEQRAAALLDATAYTTTSTFDALGRRTGLDLPTDVEGRRRHITADYSRAGHLTGLAVDGEAYVRHVSYNARGQKVLAAYGNGLLTRYLYDSDSFRLARLHVGPVRSTVAGRWSPDGPAVLDTSYGYDATGNPATLLERAPGSGISPTPDALDRVLGYDALYRLVSATGREADDPQPSQPWADTLRSADPNKVRGYRQTYVYDQVGNLTTMAHRPTGPAAGWTRTASLVPGSNRLATMSVGATTYSYTHDDSGNLTCEATSRLTTWDAGNHLATFRVATDPEAEPSVHAEYRYDGAGHRVMKVVRKATGEVAVTIYADGAFERLVRRGPGTAVTTHDQLHVLDDTNRVATERIGPPVPGDATPPVAYWVADHLRSSVAVTDNTGNGVRREEFAPYGETTFGSFARKRYRYTGKERDEESGLAYHGLRYYAPWLARWTSCDPAGLVDGHSLYAYVRGRPLSLADPTGAQGTPTGPSFADLNQLVDELSQDATVAAKLTDTRTPLPKVTGVDYAKARKAGTTAARQVSGVPSQGGVFQENHTRAVRHAKEVGLSEAELNKPGTFQTLHSRKDAVIKGEVYASDGVTVEKTLTHHNTVEGMIDADKALTPKTPTGLVDAADQTRWRTPATIDYAERAKMSWTAAAKATPASSKVVQTLKTAAKVGGVALEVAGGAVAAYELVGDVKRGDVASGIGNAAGATSSALTLTSMAIGSTAIAATGAVTGAFAGGYAIGTEVNRHLSAEVQNGIGGTINEIVNEGGWKLLFTHPFGIGM